MSSPRYGCLYCSDRRKPRTAEHVLQEAFGTTMVLEDDVCGDCNTAVFSPLDTKLVEFSRQFGFCERPADAAMNLLTGRLGFTFDSEKNVWTTTIVNRIGEPIVLPQFHFGDDPTVCTFQTDKRFMRDGHLERMVSELQRPDQISIVTDIHTQTQVGTSLVRSAPRKFVVRAPTQEKANKLLDSIRSGTFGRTFSAKSGPESRKHDQPNIEMNLDIHLGDVQRAAAKVAVNFVCKVAGPQVARGERMAGIRTFAREPLTENSGDYAMVLLETPPGMAEFVSTFVPRDRHGLLLLPSDKGHDVWIVLYGRPFALVHLAPQATMSPLGDQRLMEVALFDFKRRTHATYSMPDDWEWFGQRAIALATESRASDAIE